MVGVYGLGGILGTILFGAASTRISRRTVYLVPRLAYPVLVLVLALVPLPPFGIVLIPLFLFGFAVGLLVPFLIDSLGLRAVLTLLAAGFAMLLGTSLLHLRTAGDTYPRHAEAQL